MLKDLIESGYGLDGSTVESEQAVAPWTSEKSESSPHLIRTHKEEI